MRNITQSKIVSILVVIPCLFLTIRASQAAKPGANAASEVAFLKAIPKNATLAKVKKLLPRGTKFSAPKWDQAYGNCITVRGKISGWLWFVPTHKPDRWGMRWSQGKGNLGEKFHSSHRINRVEIVMDNGRISSSKDTQTRIKAVQKVLGKPKTYEYIKADSDSVGLTYMLPGWTAYWNLSRQRETGCFTHYGIGGKKASILSLELPDQWMGAG